MNNIKIRLALPEDSIPLEDFLAFVHGEVHRTLAKGYIACAFSDDYRRPYFIVACGADGSIIGAGAYSEELFTIDVWGLSWLSVHPDYRLKGIGEMLIQKRLELISETTAGKTVTALLATHPNKTALFTRCGFVVSGQDHEGGALMTKVIEV